MKREWQAFLSAVQFLTRLPVPDPGWEDGRLDRATTYFPLVGALIGFLCGLVLLGSQQVFGPGPTAPLLALAAGVLLTGALHEDGLADFTDGVGGGRDRERCMEIMKDSRIGSYGALALIFVTAGNFIALSSLSGEPELGIAALVAGHALSRAVLPFVTVSLDYARSPQEKAAPLSRSLGVWRKAFIIAATLLCLLPLAALLIAYAGVMTSFHRDSFSPLHCLIWPIVASVLVTLVVAVIMRRNLGDGRAMDSARRKRSALPLSSWS